MNIRGYILLAVMMGIFTLSYAAENPYSNTERECNDLGKERSQKITKDLNLIFDEQYPNIEGEITYSCYFNYFGLDVRNYLNTENEKPKRVIFANDIFEMFIQYTKGNLDLSDISKFYIQSMITESIIASDSNGGSISPKISFDPYWYKNKPSNQSLKHGTAQSAAP